MRLARHARRYGRWPRFSDDEVVQFTVEHALDLALDISDAAREATAAEAAAGTAATDRSLQRARGIFGA